MDSMKIWEVDVVETATISRTYTVIAPDARRAEAKAAIGDTISERDNAGHRNVVDRNVLDVKSVG